MILGYACINQTLKENGKFKTITVRKALTLDKDILIKKIKGLTIDNLYNTLKILEWNIEHNIFMYRLTSNMIPLATHELLKDWIWWEDKDILKLCNKIKEFVINNKIEISMHPDQFTILTNWKDDNIFNNSLSILEYHSKLSNLLGNKYLVIHVGGAYGNKEKAIETFINNFHRLSIDIKNKLIIENDDKTYTVKDVLSICNKINRPLILDFHHDRCNPSEWDIEDIIRTWDNNIPKCHISSGKDSDIDRRHADYININDFNKVLEITNEKFQIMVEAKQKELAVLDLI